MRKVSKKQAKKNRKIAKTKKTLSEMCVICKFRPAIDPAHLFPRSTFPEYYCEEWNLVGMCRECHRKYDDDLKFRQKQKDLYNIVKAHCKPEDLYRHFKI